jgi:hypothetical protein
MFGCYSARGPDADRRGKALIYLALEGAHFRRLFTLDRPRQQRTRAVAQNFSKRIGEPRFANIKTSSGLPCRNSALEPVCFLV